MYNGIIYVVFSGHDYKNIQVLLKEQAYAHFIQVYKIFIIPEIRNSISDTFLTELSKLYVYGDKFEIAS